MILLLTTLRPVMGSALPPLPAGYAFCVDLDGKYLVDLSGNFFIQPSS